LSAETTFKNGNMITNTYAADGQKLSARYLTTLAETKE
jgi:hypothetical protein